MIPQNTELFNVVEDGKSDYTTAELAAVAVFIHNAYNGVENILRKARIKRRWNIWT